MKRFLVHLAIGIPILLKFSNCLDKRQVAHVSIFGRIEGYGDNLTLICTLDKNLQSPIDNKKWYIDGRLSSINNKTNDPEKYKAQIIPDGVQLTILNFLTQDINKIYSCIIGFYQSEKLNLSESDVFRDEMINSKDDKNSDYIGTLVYVVAIVVLGLIIIACRKKILCIKGNKGDRKDEEDKSPDDEESDGDRKDEEDKSPDDEESDGDRKDEEDKSPDDEESDGDRKDEEDKSPDDEESDESSLHLEGKPLMNGQKDAVRQNRTPANEERNVNYVAPSEAIGKKRIVFVISGKALNMSFQSEKTAEGNVVERTDPKIPHREPINRGFQPDLSSARILNSGQNSTDSQNSNLNSLHDLSSSANHKHKEYNTLNLGESSFKEPLIFNSHSIAVLPEVGSFYTEKSLPQGVKPIKGGKKDEVKQEDISQADEESDEKSLLLEMKPIKGDEKDEVKQEDISPADEESDEMKPIKGDKKDEVKQEDILPADEKSDGRHQFPETENVVHRDSFHQPDKFNKNAVNNKSEIETVANREGDHGIGFRGENEGVLKPVNSGFQFPRLEKSPHKRKEDIKVKMRENSYITSFPFILPSKSAMADAGFFYAGRHQFPETENVVHRDSFHQPDKFNKNAVNNKSEIETVANREGDHGIGFRGENEGILNPINSGFQFPRLEKSPHKHKEYIEVKMRENSYITSFPFTLPSKSAMVDAGFFMQVMALRPDVFPVENCLVICWN